MPPPPIPHADPQPLSVNCAVITVSDSRWQALQEQTVPAEDQSGRLIQSQLRAAGHCIQQYQILPDDPALIQEQLVAYGQAALVQAVILSGGTGIAPRDTTYDAIVYLLDKELTGFGELFRTLSYADIGSRAIATRATAGTYRNLLIFSLPGSLHAVTLGMEKLILPELPHLVKLLRMP